MYKETQNISSFLISSALARNKREYFDALRNGRDSHEYGCLNNYVELQDALTNYNKSQLSFVEAVFEYNVARETLLKSMGVK